MLCMTLPAQRCLFCVRDSVCSEQRMSGASAGMPMRIKCLQWRTAVRCRSVHGGHACRLVAGLLALSRQAAVHGGCKPALHASRVKEWMKHEHMHIQLTRVCRAPTWHQHCHSTRSQPPPQVDLSHTCSAQAGLHHKLPRPRAACTCMHCDGPVGQIAPGPGRRTSMCPPEVAHATI
jgi:hypothetical protein